jgi:leader peptidase (prepilin peptidase) / N-methyltransferase
MKIIRAGLKIGACSITAESLRQQILPTVVAAVVFIGAVCASVTLAPGARGVMGAVLAGLMLLIALIDARSYIIPDELTATSFILGVVHEVIQNSSSQFVSAVASSTVRAAVAAGVFWTICVLYRYLRHRDGLGLGDVKLAAVAGAWLGATTIPLVIEVAALSGLACYLVRQWVLGRSFRPTDRLPFGIFFAPAIWFGWLYDIIMGG